MTLDVYILHTGELDVPFRSGFHVSIDLVDHTINFHLCLPVSVIYNEKPPGPVREASGVSAVKIHGF